MVAAHQHGTWMTPAKAAQLLAVPVARVVALAQDGALGWTKTERGHLRIARETVEQMAGLPTTVCKRAAGRKPAVQDDGCLTLDQIGTRLGLSRERVRQLERQALGKIRAALEANHMTLADFVTLARGRDPQNSQEWR